MFRLFLAHRWLRGEHQKVVGDITIKFHADILGLEEQKLHCRIILYLCYCPPVVGTDACRFKLPVLANDLHEHIPREVEHAVGNFADRVLASTHRCIYFRHIGVYFRPFLAATRLDIDIVVVLQRGAIGSRIGEHLMQFLPLLHMGCLHLATFAFLFSLCLQGKHFFGVWHRQPFLFHIVVVWFLVDVPQCATPHRTRFCPFTV